MGKSQAKCQVLEKSPDKSREKSSENSRDKSRERVGTKSETKYETEVETGAGIVTIGIETPVGTVAGTAGKGDQTAERGRAIPPAAIATTERLTEIIVIKTCARQAALAKGPLLAWSCPVLPPARPP